MSGLCLAPSGSRRCARRLGRRHEAGRDASTVYRVSAVPLSPGDEHPSRSRRIGILFICCMSLFIVGLDNTIVNVALPSISKELHASVSGLQWIVDAYTLALASLLMLSGSMADRFGRRKVRLPAALPRTFLHSCSSACSRR
jgi:hypothetical protein